MSWSTSGGCQSGEGRGGEWKGKMQARSQGVSKGSLSSPLSRGHSKRMFNEIRGNY